MKKKKSGFPKSLYQLELNNSDYGKQTTRKVLQIWKEKKFHGQVFGCRPAFFVYVSIILRGSKVPCSSGGSFALYLLPFCIRSCFILRKGRSHCSISGCVQEAVLLANRVSTA